MPLPDAQIDLPDGNWLNVDNQSPSENRRTLRMAWSTFVLDQVQHRKGVALQPFDASQQKDAESNRTCSDNTRTYDSELNWGCGFESFDSTQSINCPPTLTRLYRIL